MQLSIYCLSLAVAASSVVGTILQNGQIRITKYPNTILNTTGFNLRSYPPDAPELSYKGRWDSKFISWWSAPGLKFGFTGEQVAITFGPLTTDRTLISYRIDGQDWQFTNVTTNATHLLIIQSSSAHVDHSEPQTLGVNLSSSSSPSIFELRVTNWAYGVQISSVHVAQNASLIKIPDFSRTIEVIGDSLSAGQYATLEGISSYSYGLAAGLGNTEYSITAYPGICLFDKRCYGNLRGMFYQWFRTSDTSGRAIDIWGDEPEVWDFKQRPSADIVVINMGTNDSGPQNNVTTKGFVAQYTMLIQGIHAVWPDAQIILISLWGGFAVNGSTYIQTPLFVPEILSIHDYFNSPAYLASPVLYNATSNSTYASSTPSKPFVKYFNTTGVLQHNDIGPLFHPTDVGHVKLASQLVAWVRMVFGWALYATGPEVLSGTLYWNDMPNY